MRRIVLILCLLAFALRCASAPPANGAASVDSAVTPADLVASIAEVATGRNESLAETGLVLHRIEFRLAVGRKTTAGGKLEVLILDADASRETETSFVQEFTLEIPASRGRSAAAAAPLVPGVAELVDSAMNTARDLARAANREGLPQRLKSMELTARITRSRQLSGGITAMIPISVKTTAGIEAGKSLDEDNTVKMVFAAK